ncbi:uncharacterized protein K460DRAFT_353677 [Cucurbitaria berberidis CBS 394.84]|uniref:F-box domain-containing protein n=1 Tax=Cucurbitaria berberidis CBS 394.84 TaxID=1168544 RepID=A0A9P4LC26_9PLEO|nr:uncharacterized protein K460DRAFT_353677 [Cucurbitaria berberidis CBS 394.84]KAF1848734.1 hypothetical protein K460DRAFT_353677 [Cucurbitaria berberidis CBS 394.84]
MGILSVPEELLLNIALYVDCRDLRNLSLTCHRLRPVALVTLIRKTVVSPINIWKLVELLQIRPGLAKTLTHLRLGPISQKLHDAMAKTPRSSACWDMFFKHYPNVSKTTTWRKEIRDDGFFSAGVAVLIALAPGLKAISMGTNSTEWFGLFSAYTRNECASVTVRSQLAARLEVLQVMDEDSVYTGGPLRLRQLEIPYWMIAYNKCAPGISDPLLVLPASLESIRMVNVFTGSLFHSSSWIDKLIGSPKELPKLHHVELQFRCNMWQTAWQMRSHRQSLATLRSWEASRILFTTSFITLNLTQEPVGGEEASTQYETGCLGNAIQTCFGSYEELCKIPEALEALRRIRHAMAFVDVEIEFRKPLMKLGREAKLQGTLKPGTHREEFN